MSALPLTAAERLAVADLLSAPSADADALLDTLPPAAVRAALGGRARMRRDEALLERRVLLHVGARPGVWLAKNEVGVGLRAALLSELCSVCREAAKRHRITYGLGVGSGDLVGAVGGRAFFLELKSAAGAARESQVRYAGALAKRGVPTTFVFDGPAVLSAVDAVLDDVAAGRVPPARAGGGA